MKRILANKKVIAIFAAIGLYAAICLYAQNPINQGPYGSLFRVMSATDTATLGTSQFGPGLLIGTPTGAANYTTPSAANICAAFPQVGIMSPGTNSNFGYGLEIRNTSTGANTITMVGGSNVTLATGNTNTIAQNHTRLFIVVPTNCGNGNGTGTSTVTVYSAQDSAH